MVIFTPHLQANLPWLVARFETPFLHCQPTGFNLRLATVFMADYKVQFEVFEGPLDLLLYLIKKEEVDIYEVNLTKLATQFLEYVELMRQFDLEIAGEFLVMASTLMLIKSRELLPVEKQVVVEEEEEGEDPRWELIRQLVEYKKFKDAAAQLQTLEARQENIYPRVPGKIEFVPEAEPQKLNVSIFDLLNAVNAVLQRFAAKEAGTREIFEEEWSVSGKIEFVLAKISAQGKVRFSELFTRAASRAEVVCTFLALLELIRLKQLVCTQPEPFAEIEITKAAPGEAAAESPEQTEPDREFAADENITPLESANVSGDQPVPADQTPTANSSTGPDPTAENENPPQA